MWCEESLTCFHRSHLCLDLFWVVHFGCFVFPLDKIYIWHGSLCMVLGNCWLCVCTGTSLAIDVDFSIDVSIANPSSADSRVLGSGLICIPQVGGLGKNGLIIRVCGGTLEYSRTFIFDLEHMTFFVRPSRQQLCAGKSLLLSAGSHHQDDQRVTYTFCARMDFSVYLCL